MSAQRLALIRFRAKRGQDARLRAPTGYVQATLYTAHLNGVLLGIGTLDHATYIAGPNGTVTELPGVTFDQAVRMIQKVWRADNAKRNRGDPTNNSSRGPTYVTRQTQKQIDRVAEFMAEFRDRVRDSDGATIAELCDDHNEIEKVRSQMKKPGARTKWGIRVEWIGETVSKNSRCYIDEENE